MKSIWLLAFMLLLGGPALAQSGPRLVPCSSVSAQAVTSVPEPFNAYMNLVCWNSVGQGLAPPRGYMWTNGKINMELDAMDDDFGADGPPPAKYYWYVSLTQRAISAQNAAALRAVVLQYMNPALVNGARLLQLDAMTSSGELKQEFLFIPADPVATHGFKMLVECHAFCQKSDAPMILIVAPEPGP